MSGLIYKGKKMINWDTKLKTAVSDLEVINENVVAKSGISTPTRGRWVTNSCYNTPETLFGDQAVLTSRR